MADSPPPEPPAPGPDLADSDPDSWLKLRLRETRAMTQLRKRALLTQMRDLEQDDPPIDELVSIDRMEIRLASRVRINAIREKTRIRGSAER